MIEKPDPDLDAKISILYQTGHYMPQIARRLGLGKEKVRTSLKRTNTQSRTISEAKKIRGDIFLG